MGEAQNNLPALMNPVIGVPYQIINKQGLFRPTEEVNSGNNQNREKSQALLTAINSEQDLTDAQRKGFLDEISGVDQAIIKAESGKGSGVGKLIGGKNFDQQLADVSARIQGAIAEQKKKREGAQQSRKQQIDQPGRFLVGSTPSLINQTSSLNVGSLLA